MSADPRPVPGTDAQPWPGAGALFAAAGWGGADPYHGLARRVAARACSGRPFVVGIAGSVAAGKSMAARRLAGFLREGPGAPRVAVVAADGFLFSNSQLAAQGLADRKGFPESYDTATLVHALAELRAGRPALIPRYSHLDYDVVPGRLLEPPDVVVIEGVNLLQVHPEGAPLLPSDLIDLAVYLHADESDLRRWFAERLASLLAEARNAPASFYFRWSALSAPEAARFAGEVWDAVNAVNLRRHIAPSRYRAHLIFELNSDHTVRRVFERR